MKKAYLMVALVLLVATGCSWKMDKTVQLKPDEAKTKAESFINENLMDGKSKVKIENLAEDNGMYKFDVNFPDGRKLEAYLTKDGKKFFPQAVEIDKFAASKAGDAAGAQANNSDQQQPAQEAPKSNKPKVEAFVMSHCPYGTQIEKGLLPVIDKLGKSIDFQIKFVNYAMHGEKELKEELNQYCINKEQPAKYYTYLKCFLKSGEGESCLASSGVDAGKLKSCVAATDSKYKVTEKFNSKEGWKGQFPPFDIHTAENEQYGVQGSPSLVINGQQVESGRSPAELLKTICSAFNKAPSACSAQLSSAEPAPGFGEGEADGSTGAAGCGQ
ncbi:hypothetical protein HGA64_04745 [Candidatus Falkowbacteria bacterium]|nr:hypothetical protein [Candidatus Falkowbacteria bacterium]